MRNVIDVIDNHSFQDLLIIASLNKLADLNLANFESTKFAEVNSKQTFFSCRVDGFLSATLLYRNLHPMIVWELPSQAMEQIAS